MSIEFPSKISRSKQTYRDDLYIFPCRKVILHAILYFKLNHNVDKGNERVKKQLQNDLEENVENADNSGKSNAMNEKTDNILVLFFHGNTQNAYSWCAAAEELNSRGYDVLMMDYRQFGKSSGDLNEIGLKDDTCHWYKYAIEVLKYKTKTLSFTAYL